MAIAVANLHLEEAFDQAIRHGAKAIVVFGSAHLENDVEPPLARRLADKANRAGVSFCGPNSMGFYNPGIGLRIAGFPSPAGLRRGGVAYIAQSGAAFSALAHNERRLGFVVCVSSGSELGATIADYVEWSLRQPETRVLGLFVEQIREPARFASALDCASRLNIPVVILKVGRTARSAEMALSHTGALAGNDRAFLAFCRRHGAIVVDDLDELVATLQFFDQPRTLTVGALASMHDSGGERELVVDVAERLGIVFAQIAPATCELIRPFLDPGLVAENPLDAWGTPRDFTSRYEGALRALLSDPSVSALIFFSDVRDDYWYSTGVAAAIRAIAAHTEKPIAIATNYSKTTNSILALDLAEDGIPVIEGTREALLAFRHASQWRDRVCRREKYEHAAPSGVVEKWRSRLISGATLPEHDGLALLADFGIKTVFAERASTLQGALEAAGKIGYPVVMKTASGHAHKSEVRGVHLALANESDIEAAYGDLAMRLGAEVLVSAMATPGVEIGLGAIVDPCFGPMVVVSAGGIFIEHLGDSVASLAPLSAEEATRLLRELRTYRLLEGVRGNQPVDIESLAILISRFSTMVDVLSDEILEVDVNPIIANVSEAVAVDALIIPKSGKK